MPIKDVETIAKWMDKPRRKFASVSSVLYVIVTSILLCLFAAAVGMFISRDRFLSMRSGVEATIKASGIRVFVVTTRGDLFECRIDNGPGAIPRYQEITFNYRELQWDFEKK